MIGNTAWPSNKSRDELLNLNVSTVINGSVHRKNVIFNMTFRPWYLVSFHSKVMTLLLGDIISTGTPGAVVIRDGDVGGMIYAKSKDRWAIFFSGFPYSIRVA
jgi:2-keto-4-pentenoate hydratase/2-oxohepta-3-ene-1,7-dioic acid hydratase in catechol pathway